MYFLPPLILQIKFQCHFSTIYWPISSSFEDFWDPTFALALYSLWQHQPIIIHVQTNDTNFLSSCHLNLPPLTPFICVDFLCLSRYVCINHLSIHILASHNFLLLSSPKAKHIGYWHPSIFKFT